jgi:hypothetical protein
MHRGIRQPYRIVVRKPEERPFKRPGHRWEENIKMDLKSNHACMDTLLSLLHLLH